MLIFHQPYGGALERARIFPGDDSTDALRLSARFADGTRVNGWRGAALPAATVDIIGMDDCISGRRSGRVSE